MARTEGGGSGSTDQRGQTESEAAAATSTRASSPRRPAGGGRQPAGGTEVISYQDRQPDISVGITGGGAAGLGGFGSYGTGGTGNGFYITPDSINWALTSTLTRDQAINEAWGVVVTSAGMEQIDVPVNWWPGLEATDPSWLWNNRYYWKDKEMGFAPDVAEFWPEEWAYPATSFLLQDNQTGFEQDIWVRYDPSRAAQQFYIMDPDTRADMYTKLVNAGMIDKGYAGLTEYTAEGAAAFSEALSWANYYGKSVDTVLDLGAETFRRRGGWGGGGGGGRGPTVKVEIPDYETMLADAKNMLKTQLGRDPKDWEMALIADEMKRQYGSWADAKTREALGGNGTYEVPDPNKLTQQFLETTYADEIERIEDRGDTRVNNSLLLSAATKGLNMIGGYGG